MRLQEFKRHRAGTTSRFVKRVADVAGAADYELVVAGAHKAVERVFKDSDFQLKIDPKRSFDDAEREFRSAAEAQAQEFNEQARLEKPSELPLFKKPPPAPSLARSVFVSLRRIRGEGTFWGPWAFPYFLPTGFSIFVWPPPLCTLSACVMPVSGDQDLFLFRQGIFWTLLQSSVAGGTARDCLFFSNPPLVGCSLFTWNLLAIRIFGFTSGLGTFTMRGFS
jgi:hypothetical protein